MRPLIWTVQMKFMSAHGEHTQRITCFEFFLTNAALGFVHWTCLCSYHQVGLVHKLLCHCGLLSNFKHLLQLGSLCMPHVFQWCEFFNWQFQEMSMILWIQCQLLSWLACVCACWCCRLCCPVCCCCWTKWSIPPKISKMWGSACRILMAKIAKCLTAIQAQTAAQSQQQATMPNMCWDHCWQTLTKFPQSMPQDLVLGHLECFASIQLNARPNQWMQSPPRWHGKVQAVQQMTTRRKPELHIAVG